MMQACLLSWRLSLQRQRNRDDKHYKPKWWCWFSLQVKGIKSAFFIAGGEQKQYDVRKPVLITIGENPENKATTTGLIFTYYTWNRCHALTGLLVFVQVL